MRIFIFTMACVFFGPFLFSCEEDPTRAELLTTRTWQYKSISVSPSIEFGGTSISDYYSLLEPCAQDDELTLREAGTSKTYQWGEGPSKCDPTDPQIFEEGTWELTNGDRTLTFTTTDGFSIDWDLIQVGTDIFKVSYEVDINDQIFTVTTEFKVKPQ